MKIITFTYNREASAIIQSTLMSEESRADRDLYKPASTELIDRMDTPPQTPPIKQKFCIPGTWQ